MNDLMIQLLDQFEAGLRERAVQVMATVNDEKHRFPMELNKKQCSLMLLCVSTVKRTFLVLKERVKSIREML